LEKVTKNIIVEEGGEMLRKHVGEHEEENSQLKATAVKLQGLVDSSAEIVAML
jgi:hypothetical protein